MPFDIVLATIGGTVLVVGLFSEALKRSVLQEPLICVAVGAAVGPYGLGWLEHVDASQSAILERLAHLTLAIALMAAALRVTAEHVRRLWRPVVVLLTLGMLGMWLVSSLSAAWLLGLPLSAALLLGAIVTPTDPVVASNIVTGRFAQRHLPDRVRSCLTMESGANDGLSYLFIMLPIIVLDAELGRPWGNWFTNTVLQGLLLSVVLGALLGFGAGRLLHWANRSRMIESYSFLTFTTTLSLFTLGAAGLLGSNSLLAVFVAGAVFTLSTDTGEAHQEERIQESMSKLFTLPTFIVFGAAMPIGAWLDLGWPLVAFVAAVLLLRRLPVVAALSPMMRGTLRRHDAVYLGWFGPIGIAALYYSAYALERTGYEPLWHAASAVILASIVVHGASAAPFTRIYDRAEETAARS